MFHSVPPVPRVKMERFAPFNRPYQRLPEELGLPARRRKIRPDKNTYHLIIN